MEYIQQYYNGQSNLTKGQHRSALIDILCHVMSSLVWSNRK